MTNTRTPRTCCVCGTRLSARNCDPRNGSSDLCDTCFEQAGFENDHMDGNHEPGTERRCPICDPSIVPNAEHQAGHHNTAAHSHTSHAACYEHGRHAATPAGRAWCRSHPELSRDGDTAQGDA